MLQILKINKKTKEQTKIFVEDIDGIREFINSVKTNDLRKNLIYIQRTDEVEDFFVETYKPQFYTIDILLDLIEIHILPNGIRRNISYTQIKKNNNKTLHKVLVRIQEELVEQMKKINVDVEMYSGQYTESTTHSITIELQDKEFDERAICTIQFNKERWTYEITSMMSSRLQDLMDIIKRVFERKTASTRNYRRKTYGNQS